MKYRYYIEKETLAMRNYGVYRRLIGKKELWEYKYNTTKWFRTPTPDMMNLRQLTDTEVFTKLL